MVVYGAAGPDSRGLARELLALAAAERWGLSPLPELARSPRGKPCFPNRPDLQFNWSHSGPLVLCALGESPVGADIQMVKAWRPGLPARVCAPAELDWLAEQPDRWAAFTALWTLKESRVKCTGQGLTVPIRSIAVPLPGGGDAPLFRDGLWFRLYAGPDWRAAVCADSPPPPSILWRDLPPKGAVPLGP